jgi:hypothetical protein
VGPGGQQRLGAADVGAGRVAREQRRRRGVGVRGPS